MHWIDGHVKEMLAGRDVVIVTTGPVKSKILLERIASVAGAAVQIFEHTRVARRVAGPGSIRFATISASDHEAVFLASVVGLDEDISLTRPCKEVAS